jgi:cytochrome P450
MRTLADMPGPGALPILGVAYQLRTRPLDFLQDIAARYGEICALPLGLKRVVFLSAPTHIQHVLQTAHHKYVTSPRKRMFGLLLGNGLLVSDGEFWRHQRGVVQNAFRAADLAYYVDLVSQVAQERVDEWRKRPNGAALDVFAEMSTITMMVILRTMFGRDVQDGHPQIVAAFTDAMRFLQRRWLAMVRPPMWMPTPANRAFLRNRAVADDIVYGLIREARASGASSGGRGLLSILMNRQFGRANPEISDQEMRDELITILVAGYDTTATALSWTLYLLSLHPDALRRVQAEVAAVAESGATGGEELKFTDATIKESMRLYPPAWALTRRAVTQDSIDEYTIPAGTTVLVSPYVTHRLESLWPRPLDFRPSRFMEADPPRFAFFPFGGGQRLCVGASFAIMEARTVLAVLLQHFEPQPPDIPPVPSPQITMPPHRLVMKFRRR